MAKRRKKGPSHTLKAEDRHWYGKRQAARDTKRDEKRDATRSAGTGTARQSGAGASRPASMGAVARRRPGPGNRRGSGVARGAGPIGGTEGPEVVAGRNPVVEALRAGIPASALYVLGGAVAPRDERVRTAIQLAADAGVPLLDAGKAQLDRMTAGAVHQGIALEVPAYDYAHPDDLLTRGSAAPTLLVALDGVTDPRNLGAIVRSVAAFGGHGVVVPERRAAGVTAGAWKASAGTLATVPVARATNLTRTLRAYQEAGLFVAGLDAGAAATVDTLDVAAEALVLVVGSEGRGLSRLVAETCDVLVRVPMSDQAESLNAGVAAGISLYEIARRRSD